MDTARSFTTPQMDDADAIRHLLSVGDHQAALSRAHAALTNDPDNGRLWLLAATAARHLGSIDQAAGFSRQATVLMPDRAEAWAQLGALLTLKKDHAGAAEAYRVAIRLAPRDGSHHAGLGLALWMTANLPAARDALNASVRLRPRDAVSRNLLGAVLWAMGEPAAALKTWRAAAASAPEFLPARINLTHGYTALHQYPAALAACEQAIRIAPGDDALLTTRIYLKKKMADWSAHDDYERWRNDRARPGQGVDPWSLMALCDDPKANLRHARSYAARFATARHRPPCRPFDGRLRVGYLTSDVSDHATLHLLTGVLEQHDKTRHDIHLVALNRPDQAAITRRAQSAVQHLHECHGMPDDRLTGLLRDLQLDIAVDLKGYTQNARANVVAAGIAPVQINFLGYPGSLGSPAWDYLIADPVVIPPKQRANYDESIIYLPDSYQPNDNRRPRPEPRTSRADHGLPDDSLVLCCFNDPYKLSPVEFDLWACLMRDHPDSVLWLLASNPWAESNLRHEARRRGIDDARVIMAPKLPQEAHLERQRHADLFLDCFNYNAHTTASDALWMGLPVLTLQGQQFSARVSASLLTAMGLPQLISQSPQDYLARARQLLENPRALADLRKQLNRNRDTAALFDTARFTRHLEAGYAAAMERCRAGLAPHDIRL